jgi:hypothetical protein
MVVVSAVYRLTSDLFKTLSEKESEILRSSFVIRRNHSEMP